MSKLGLASFLFVYFFSVLTAEFEAHRKPTRQEAEPWLGSFRFGPETVVLTWEGELILLLDKLRVPVDGEWHDTVPTFAVRHRASWAEDGSEIQLNEQHNLGSHWHYSYALSEDRKRLHKSVETGGSWQVVRTYERLRR